VKPHPLLYPFSFIYGCVIWLRNWFFDIEILKSVDVGVPVVSVGNITAGGTGKTPMVIEIGGMLIEAGKKIAVVSRGYGRESSGTMVVCDGKQILADAAKGGDEPVLIAHRLKSAVVIVDKNRVNAARKAVNEFGAEVIILDDGFQHRYVKRKIDIVLMDENNSPFNTSMLPAGYRRELRSSLRRANAVVATKVASQVSALTILERKEVTAQNKFSSSFQAVGVRHVLGEVQQSLQLLKSHSAIVVSGIAHPENFLRELEKLGVKVKNAFSFNDHHRYTREDVIRILNSFVNEKADFILTTEKDGVKLEAFREELNIVPIFSLVMDVSVHQKERWKKFILSAIE